MNVGLVLSGGFARGAAQIGFIKGLLESIDISDIKLISGSSIGALNALAISTNSLDYLLDVYLNSDFINLKNLKLSIQNKLIDQVINCLCEKTKNIRIPLYITGTCMNTLSTHYFYLNEKSKKEDVNRAINISLSFPLVNGLFKKEKRRLYIDGGALDNVPTFPFLCEKYDDIDILIILHCYPKFIPPLDIVKKIKVVVDIDCTSRCQEKASSFSLRSSNLSTMVKSGYEYGKEFSKMVFTSNNLDEIKKNTQKFIIQECEIRKKAKWTSLRLVHMLNRVQISRRFKIK